MATHVANLKKDEDYMSPSEKYQLKREIVAMDNLVRSLTMKSNDTADGDEDFHCKICFEMPVAKVFVCGVCELLLCELCKTRLCEPGAKNVVCPGCRSDFSNGVNLRRSRIVEKVIRGIQAGPSCS